MCYVHCSASLHPVVFLSPYQFTIELHHTTGAVTPLRRTYVQPNKQPYPKQQPPDKKELHQHGSNLQLPPPGQLTTLATSLGNISTGQDVQKEKKEKKNEGQILHPKLSLRGRTFGLDLRESYDKNYPTPLPLTGRSRGLRLFAGRLKCETPWVYINMLMPLHQWPVLWLGLVNGEGVYEGEFGKEKDCLCGSVWGSAVCLYVFGGEAVVKLSKGCIQMDMSTEGVESSALQTQS